MKIRHARFEDADAIAHVLVDTFMASNREVLSEEAWQRRKREWTYEVSARNWETVLTELADGSDPLSCLYVAEDEHGEIVGMCYGCPAQESKPPIDTGEIDVLYVLESHQHQGIGRALTKVTAAHLARLGMTKLHICTPVANAPGRVFYERIGGVEVGGRDDYSDGERIPLVIYEWADIQQLVNGAEEYL
jgi:ribosomal protein S18 acetylase RimI-like enzyme